MSLHPGSPQPSHRLGRATGQKISWYHDSDAASNRQCVYCGTDVSEASATPWDKEHLIANNFVPSGSMGVSAFNFMFRVCRPCNARKAVAERHVSSVTLINGPGRLDDPRAASVAESKSVHDFHPSKPGVPMGQAHEEHSISGTFGPASINVGFVAPPQAVRSEIEELALRHVQGMLALITTKDYQQRVNFLPAGMVVLMGHYGRRDWGHPWAVEVARRVAAWPCYANIVSADGYFKVIIRCHEEQGWFWALEWNKFMRVIGGASESATSLFTNLPDERWFRTPTGRAREECALRDEDDQLFVGEVLG